MAQSSLYKLGTIVSTDVNITDDDARDLGNVDIKTMPNQDVDIIDDSSRSLGNTQVTNDLSLAGEINLATLDHGQTQADEASPAPLNGGASLAVTEGATLRISADSGNSGDVYIGGSAVTTNDGYPLAPGEAVEIRTDDVSKVHIESGTGTNSVGWLVESA